LRDKGLLDVSVAEGDKRRRDVSFTKVSESLFAAMR